MEDILGLFQRMKEMYIRYMDSPFALGHDKLASERRALLEQEGNIYQYPYVEALPPFVSSKKHIVDVCNELSVTNEFAEFANKGLFSNKLQMHQHQYESFMEVISNKKNVVITSGTGSGKTESFLLPLIYNILDESKKWATPGIPGEHWWETGKKWSPKRAHEKRKAAVRGLILYPLNALVEDQLVRLRKALDSEESRKWMKTNRDNNLIYFGRYTGKTPVPGPLSNLNKVRTLKTTMNKMGSKQYELWRRFNELLEKTVNIPDQSSRQNIILELQSEVDHDVLNFSEWNLEQIKLIKKKLREKLHEKLAFLNQVDGSEMISRWDMQETPPDILITNFSMLNIILTREIEQRIFESTREWLLEDPSNTFYLILDELHAYRGTAGTEVSYVLRSLLDRLDLTPDSPQLRILATSASLDQSGKGFLEDFFGVPIEKFKIISGERENADKYTISNTFINGKNQFAHYFDTINNGGDWLYTCGQLCRVFGIPINVNNPEESLYNALETSGALYTFLNACEKPTSIKKLSKDLFNEDTDLRHIGGLLSVIAKAKHHGEVILPLRVHLFFRNFQGLWACSNPNCSEVNMEYYYIGRNIGKLYYQPMIQCGCGSRVLDFYYCQNCGDNFLGGFKTLENNELGSEQYILSAEFPDLEQLPDKLPPSKKFGKYTIYWPSLDLDPEAKPWKRTLTGDEPDPQGNTKHIMKFKWEKAKFNSKIGGICADKHEATGHWFKIENLDAEAAEMPAFPIICPNCADNWEIRIPGEPLNSIKKTRSPIRGQRTGFDMVAQVMLDALMRELPYNEQPKAVLFSDSRQDAAKLSAKLEINHYRQLIRFVVVKVIREQNNGLRSFIKRVKGEVLTEDEAKLADIYWNETHEAMLIENYLKGSNLPIARVAEAKKIVESAESYPRLGDLWDSVERELLKLGVNPGGPENSLKNFAGMKWTSLYNWDNINNPYANTFNLNANQLGFRERITGKLREHVVLDVLFSQRKRDLESIALSIISSDTERVFEESLGEGSNFWREFVDSSIRILGSLRRFDNNKNESDLPPNQLKSYWKAIAKSKSISEDQFLDRAHRIFSSLRGVKQYLLQSDELQIVPFNQLIYSCLKCHRVHLHYSCGVCTDCYSELKETTLEESVVNDYYRFLSEDKKTIRRLHSEEMTGQTDSDDALKRQQLFQAIYDSDDLPLVDEIDILSVTTTMEAGVDIGSLRIVAMSNMPPQRFNYQQRVGRCGRRGSPLSVSLTLCRGRSHDDWYFDNLDKITGDPPPQPYIDLKSSKIFRRVLNKEMLFYAFKDSGLTYEGIGGESVHGEYGNRNDWDAYKDRVSEYLVSKQGLDRLNKVIKSLSIMTKISSEDIEKAKNNILNEQLIIEITRISKDSRYSSNSLSENLAAAGLLPMFGFPTRVRVLHHRQRNSHNSVYELSNGTVDRDLEMAINDYSPGSEVIKDKIKHRAAGVAHYWIQGRNVKAESNPLGQIKTILLCKNCHILLDKEIIDECPSCNNILDADESTFKSIRISEPQGFRSDWIERDYKEDFEWPSRNSIPRLAQDRSNSTYSSNEVYNITYSCQEGDVYALNDRNGDLFTFIKARDEYQGWIEKSAVKDGFIPSLTSIEEQVALAAIKNTEVLIISPVNINMGMSFDPIELGSRSGLISFGFLFRRVATMLLDVDSDEIQLGIRSFYNNGTDSLTGQIFFADRLINGAGYAKYLSQETVMKKILDDICGDLTYIPKLLSHVCDSSCYDCLRTYENMSYHGILDWRLGLDAAHFLRDGKTPKIGTQWLDLVERSLKNLIDNYEELEHEWYSGVPALKFQIDGNKIIALFAHPFWNIKNEDYFTKELSEATAEAELLADKIKYYNIFDLVRRPTWVIQRMIEGNE